MIERPSDNLHGAEKIIFRERAEPNAEFPFAPMTAASLEKLVEIGNIFHGVKK